VWPVRISPGYFKTRIIDCHWHCRVSDPENDLWTRLEMHHLQKTKTGSQYNPIDTLQKTELCVLCSVMGQKQGYRIWNFPKKERNFGKDRNLISGQPASTTLDLNSVARHHSARPNWYFALFYMPGPLLVGWADMRNQRTYQLNGHNFFPFFANNSRKICLCTEENLVHDSSSSQFPSISLNITCEMAQKWSFCTFCESNKGTKKMEKWEIYFQCISQLIRAFTFTKISIKYTVRCLHTFHM
jgi:hypothetical protein